MTKRAIGLLATSIVALGCATPGPSREDQIMEAKWRAADAEQLKYVAQDEERIRKDLTEIDDMYAKSCSDPAQLGKTGQLCEHILLARSSSRQSLWECKRRRQEIELGQARRRLDAEGRAYEADMDRQRRIQQAFQPKPQLTCHTNQWGKDNFTTTCD